MVKKYGEVLFESMDEIIKQANIIHTLVDDPDMSKEDLDALYKKGNEKMEEALNAMYKAKEKLSQ